MNFIIFDMEWNCVSDVRVSEMGEYYNVISEKTICFDEIIEIGAVKVNEKMELIDEFRAFVKPHIYKKINPRVEKLTKITEEELESGLKFKEVLKSFSEWMGNNYILCSWSDEDIRTLFRNIEYYYDGYNMDKLVLPYMDIQKYCCTLLGHKKRKSLSYIAKERGIKVIGKKIHQAIDDSKVTYEIFKKLYDKNRIQPYIAEDINYFFKSIDENIDESIDYDFNNQEVELDGEPLTNSIMDLLGGIKIVES